MKTDIQIAQEATLVPIGQIAKKLEIPEDKLEYYVSYKSIIAL